MTNRPLIDISTKRTIISILLFSLVFPAGAMWLFFKGNMTEINAFLFIDYDLPKQWYYRDMWTEIGQLFPAIFIYRLTRNKKAERIMANVYLIYVCVDAALFFLCYNTWDYTIVYSFIIPVGAVVWLASYLKIPVMQMLKEWVMGGWVRFSDKVFQVKRMIRGMKYKSATQR